MQSLSCAQVSDEWFDGVVTKGLPRGGYGSSFSDSRREEPHGLIQVARPADGKDPEPEAPAAAEDKEAAEAAGTPEPEAPPIVRKEFVRFNSESPARPAEEADDKNQEGDVRKKGGRHQGKAPHFGDEVRFRIATHRKTGVKRAVELTVTVSAREKLDKEIEQKLDTMTRELGVVDRVKAGGGFIKCCDRQEDVYFPFHEVREAASDAQPASGDSQAASAEGEAKQQRPSGQRPSKSALREGDEVSFYVYEEQDDESGRSRPRMTALRVQKLPPGSVSFEEFIRSDVEGKVTKAPKEPRNGPEILGIITLPDAPADVAAPAVEENAEAVAADEDGAKEGKKKKGTLKKRKKVTVAFRLSDTEDMSYIPSSGDRVVFDEVLDKRSGKHKAIRVRVLELNSKHRETGVIATMKDDFGFIKCAERASDAYFRFSDVMSVRNDFRVGTEVSFDASVDSSKPDSARATRIVILPHGSIQWETIVAEEIPGEVTVVPSKRSNNNNSRGGHAKLLQKGHHGKIRFTLPDGKMIIDLLPELKQQVDAALITDDPSDVKEGEEVRFEFPTSLSKFERAMIHEYCEWLGIDHESAGDKQNRRLAVVAKSKLLAADIAAKQAPIPESEVEFKMEDVADVRYDPRVGDQIKFNLALSKRTKQLVCKAVVCVKAAAGSQKKAGDAKESGKAEAAKAEGFITVVKSEGFGFIRPANKGQGVEENIFFHVNAVVSGQRIDELKEGMEVVYTASYDEKKKKSRALGIFVVPAGTIKEIEVERVRGVVTRASILNKPKSNARFSKAPNNKPMSTIGKIHLASSGGGSDEDKEEAEAGNDDDDEQDAEEETEAETNEEAGAQGEEESKTEGEAAEGKTTKKGEHKAATKKKAEKSVFFYHIQDVSDLAAVLREGDEVEFLPQATAKGMRATKIQLIASHAKQGVVVKVSEDLGGVIRADGEDALEARFIARNVLRGDILKEGDRVEFAYKAAVPLSKKKKAAVSEEAAEEAAADESESEATLGQAMSVLRIGASSAEDQQSSRREARAVNSGLLQTMREFGVNAMAASRNAAGPDGTRGFVENWRSDLVNATAKASDVVETPAVATDEAAEADAAAETSA